MTEILQLVLAISVFTFSVCSMLSVGLAYTVQEVFAPLREPTAVIRAVVANFVLVPILAVLITRLLPLAPGIETGLILLGCAAGAPFLIKLTVVARADVALSATLLLLLVPLSVLFMPLAVPRLAPEAHVSAGPIARELALTLLLPMAIGLFVKARASRWAERLQPVMAKTSTIAIIVLFASTIALNLPAILALGLHALLAALLLILGAFAIGYVLARPGRGRRTVHALGTAQRCIAAATIVANQSIADPDALVMVVLTSLVGMVVLFPLAHRLRKPAATSPAPPEDLAATTA